MDQRLLSRFALLCALSGLSLSACADEAVEAANIFQPATGVDGGGTGSGADSGLPPTSWPGQGQGENPPTDAGNGDGGEGDAAVILEPPPPPPRKAKCVQKDSQVIMMGDSYINWLSHTFPADMERESGQKWRLEAIGGMSMATGGAGVFTNTYIPNQFDTAIAADPDAHTVLMDGGGNDVLVGWISDLGIEACKETGSSKLPVCQNLVTKALEAAEKLMVRMVAAGIKDVVYFFYPHVPNNRSLGGPNPNEILDYALPMIADFCRGREAASNGALRCQFVDMVPVFENHTPEWFNEDIHPNSLGSAGMAKELWSKMTTWCVGQKESSGCCEP